MKDFIVEKKSKNNFRIGKTAEKKKKEKRKKLLEKEDEVLEKLIIAVEKIAKERGIKVDLNFK